MSTRKAVISRWAVYYHGIEISKFKINSVTILERGYLREVLLTILTTVRQFEMFNHFYLIYDDVT